MEYISDYQIEREAGRRRGGGGKTAESIWQVISTEKKFSKLAELIEQNRGLADDLDQMDKKITFFAPTNEAFDRLKEIVGKEDYDEEIRGMIGRRRGNDDDDDEEEMRRRRDPRRGRGGDQPIKLEEFIKYHMIQDVVEMKDFYDGQLLKSQLKLKELGGEFQKIRVCRVFGAIRLNLLTRIEQADIRTENGIVHAVDWVLSPPLNTFDTLYRLPVKFSTFISAMSECGLENKLGGEQLTCFVPTNSAWQQMNENDLLYLFCPFGNGRNDLKKILEYHASVCPELNYWYDLKTSGGGKREKTLPTLLSDEDITVETIQLVTKQGGKVPHPHEFLFVLNKGEARVEVTDIVTKNGTCHVINSVLIPKSIMLPSMRPHKCRRDY